MVELIIREFALDSEHEEDGLDNKPFVFAQKMVIIMFTDV